MKVSIHQPHFFPWMGYFDKMATADVFVLLDEVQFEKQSQMNRNRVIDQNGQIKYLSIPVDVKDFLNKKYNEIKCSNTDWVDKHLNILKNYYRESKYKEEIISDLEGLFSKEVDSVCAFVCKSVEYIKNILGIDTQIIYQSELNNSIIGKKSDLVLGICNELHADIYFSGKGASVDYLDKEKFKKSNIEIEFQEFVPPVYQQLHVNEFVPGLSMLDVLFNCGKEKTKDIFWENFWNRKK